ncbi:alpha/beta hydrolase [Pseudorhodobacter sp. W20_MBD10_FR17]|uniref:alpha/beta hydrolase n=1 Tax=Pseudorhodobacter sp. W20_MBD10_FR17 TaxID=3240266 RepID=UPI003F990098
MRRFGKALGRILLALAALTALAFIVAAKEPVDRTITFDPATLGPDLDAYLASEEAKFPDITPTTEKQIIWAGEKGAKTPLSVVYLHGFSATKYEIKPVPDRVAASLGANLFYTRLSGHGRSSAAMAEPRAGDWINDMAEALAIGRRLGDRVIVISTSTGGTLAAIAATDPDLSQNLAGIVFVSANFGIDKTASFLLNLPFVREWGPIVAGAERSFDIRNADHAKFWTTRYPTVAAIPMEALVKYALAQDYAKASVPALFIYAMDDRVVQPRVTAKIADAWGGPHDTYHPDLTDKDDRYHHVIAGDIMSPNQTAPTIARILEWAKGL